MEHIDGLPTREIPYKRKEKGQEGLGITSGSYTTTTRYKSLTTIPHVPPDPTI
jgi:hypothetical protein